MPKEMSACQSECKAAAENMLVAAGVPTDHPLLNMLQQFITQFGPIATQALLAWLLSMLPKPPVPTP